MLFERALHLTRRLAPDTWPARIASWRERARGVDFSRPASVESLGLDRARSVDYSPSDDRHLRALLRHVAPGPQHRVVDLGCGKGRAMRTMLDHGFGRVDGVELSAELAAIARRNFERLGIPETRTRIFQGDAAAFDALDPYSHVYLYNPFPTVVMEQVAANLVSSHARRRRRLTVIYYNAVCEEVFLARAPFHRALQTWDREGNRSVVLELGA